MFVVDTFIHNNDRNNGNWGLLIGKYETSIAPVYDNGNAFFNKRNPSLFAKRLSDENAIKEDALNGRSFFLDDEDKRINPLVYMRQNRNKDCDAAILRFISKINMRQICDLIKEIPAEAYGLKIMEKEQRQFYIDLLKTTYEDGILPIARQIQGS